MHGHVFAGDLILTLVIGVLLFGVTGSITYNPGLLFDLNPSIQIACEDMTMHPRQETLLEIRHMLHPSARYAVAPSCAGMKWR